MKKLLSLLAITLLSYGLSSAAEQEKGGSPTIKKEFKHPDRIKYDGSCMTIDGKDMFVYSAAFHYFRCPQELWRDRFQKIKEAGFNTVETYIPWNWHERDMPEDINDTSKFDFTDLKAWLDMAHNEFGFYTIARPGPFICAEWSGGAYPRWLAKYGPGKGGFWLRGADSEHIKWCVHWFDAISKFLEDEQLTRKPKGGKGVILFQIENEYDAHGCSNKEDFLKALYFSAVNNGIDVPVFTCLTSQCRGSNDPVLSQVFDCDNYYVRDLSDAPSCAHRMAGLRRHQSDAPGFVTELQGGWFSTVTNQLSEDHYSDHRHFKAIGLMTILGGGTGINYYMYFGGTHFAGWGARGMTTSYDYNAAIRESGAVGPKYLSSKEIGHFIHTFEDQLVRSEGGPCQFENAPKELFGGIRVATDGTKFVFLHNTSPNKTIRGKARIVPGKFSKPTEPIYNVNQDGEAVLIKTSEEAGDSLTIEPFDVEFDLPGVDTKVLVIRPGTEAAQGEWWPKKQEGPRRPAVVPDPVRIAYAERCEDPFTKAQWQPLPEKASLTDVGINDFRYSLYRSNVKLNAQEAGKQNRLLFNMYTRDIVSVQVNGQLAKRLFPHKADAQTWLTRNCYDRIREDEFDNRFDISGLLKKGDNEILVVYENLGHAHGYVPMEELSGIRKAGIADNDTLISRQLEWQFAADAAGVTEGWTQPGFTPKKWTKVALNTTGEVLRKGNGIQPMEVPDGLFTWYRVAFSLPAKDPDVWIPWLAKINASGNGYMWLNGHNIGRHWEIGPQREYYLPECWLNFGSDEKNVLVFGLRQTQNGASVKAVEIAPYPDSGEVRRFSFNRLLE